MKFKPAEETKPFIKLGIFGFAGSGKSVLALSAPGHKLAIDTESGLSPYSSLTKFDVLHSQNFGEIKSVIDDLYVNPPTEETTIIIDSASIIWAGLQQSMLEKKMQEKGVKLLEGTEKVQLSMADWGILKRWNNDILTTLMGLKCHVICTFREAEIRDEHTFKGTGEFVPQWEKNTAYVFDFVGRVHDRKITFKKGRMAKEGKLIDYIGKIVDIPNVSTDEDLKKIWPCLFGEATAAPTDGHHVSNGASIDLGKDPEALRLSKEIRKHWLPKRGISNDQIEAYLASKTTVEGEPVAIRDEDGHVHLSSMLPKHLKWLVDILSNDDKSMQLVAKIGGKA